MSPSEWICSSAACDIVVAGEHIHSEGLNGLRQARADARAAGGDGQRSTHIDHRPLGGRNAWFTHHGHAVRNGFDTRVGTGTERIGLE